MLEEKGIVEMKRRNPTWFYLALVVCVFVLSVAAPLAWNRVRPLELPAAVAPQDPKPESVVVAEPVAVPASPVLEAPPAAVAVVEAPPVALSLAPEQAEPAPPVSELVLPEPELTAAPLMRHPPSPLEGPAAPPKDSAEDAQAKIAARLASGWLPSPGLLLTQLDALKRTPAIAPWATGVQRKISELVRCQATESTRLKSLVRDLRQSLLAAVDLSAKLDSEPDQVSLRRAAYALARRVDLWEAAVELAGPLPTNKADAHDASHDAVALGPVDRRTGTSQTASDESPRFGRRVGGWLNLRQNDSRHHDRSRRGPSGPEPELAPAREEVARLLEDVERYEQSRLITDAQTMAVSIRSLSAEDSPVAKQLARQLETHYRNANFRAAITSDFLNLLLPQPTSVEHEVDDEIAGAQVYGQSTAFTTLGLRFVPDPNLFRVVLVANGVVESQTSAHSGPAVFHNEGQTSYNVYRPITLSRDGLKLGDVEADADSHSNVVGISTDYDHWPFLSPLARHIASKKEQQQHDSALREVEDKVAAEARERFSKQLDPRLDRAVANFKAKVWQPLVALGLSPTPLDMYTTDKRMVSRIRVGSTDQLAAHTPRPQAPSDSLASMQIHESLLNNTIVQLHLDGEDLTLPQLHQRLAKELNREPKDTADTLPSNVHIKFADQDSVRVRCNDGRVELLLTLAEVRKGQDRWSNLVVRAYYEPEGTGLTARLVRNAPIEMTGERLTAGSQIALRGAFSKLLSKSRSIVLVPRTLVDNPRLKNLEVTQFQIQDGWIGVAIGPKHKGLDGNGAITATDLPRWRLANRPAQEVRRP